MLKVLELFGGIGACSNALKRLNINFEIADYVEIDKYAVKSYNAIYETDFEPQDITKWDKDIKVDLIMHGSPCQDFSIAGHQAGGDKDSGTRSSLMWHTVRIVEKLKPKYVVWENVKNVLSKKHKHNFEAYLKTMEELGYTNYYKVLNAKDYGIPQNRERVFTVSILNGSEFQFPLKQELKLRLKDLLEDEVDEKYYLSDGIVDNIKFKNNHAGECVQVGQMYGTEKEPNPQAGRIYDSEGISPTMDSCSGGNRMPKVLIKDTRISDDVGENFNVKRADMVIKHLVDTNQIDELPCCCDSTINNPKVREISNCITSRYDAGIQNQKQIGLCVVEEVQNNSPLKIKNATKKGYDEAFEGDSVNLQRPTSETRRGRVGHEVAQTLDTSCSQGVVTNERK